MVIAATMPGLLGADPALRLLGPAYATRLQVARAGGALVADAAGTYQPVAAGLPRFQGAAQRLLVEGAASNLIRNPRLEGAAPGAQVGVNAALPSFWSIVSALGLKVGVLETGVENGLPYLDLQITGTTNASGSLRLSMENGNAPAAPGQTWTASVFLRLLAGGTAGLAVRTMLVERNSGGSFLTSNLGPSFVPAGASLGRQRLVQTYTTAQSSTTQITPEFTIGAEAGVAVDVTLRIGAPQLEMGGGATSPMLPPAGAPAVSSRAADQAVWAPQGGIAGEGTVLLRAMLPSVAGFGTHQGLFQMDDGTDANRIALRNTSAGSGLYGVADSGGANLATLPGGNMAPGQPFRAALAWSAGELAFCLNGGGVQTAAAAMPGGLKRMLVGHAAAALNRPANGEIEFIDYRTLRLPNTMLQALTAA